MFPRRMSWDNEDVHTPQKFGESRPASFCVWMHNLNDGCVISCRHNDDHSIFRIDQYRKLR